jgi:carboxyl-terminal processing protease
MRRSRFVLLVTSLVVVLFVLGSGAALRAGAGEGSYKQMLLFSEILSYVVDNYVDPVDTGKLMSGAYEGLMGGLDAHGAYLSPAEVEIWKKGVAPGATADTGMTVLRNGPVLQVVSVAKGSSAEAAAVVPGDQIRKVAGRSVRDLSLDQALRLLHGPAGSTVSVDLLRVKDLKRENVALALSARTDRPFLLDVDGGVAVLHVNDIDRLPSDALVEELASVKDRGVDRLLIDLRDVASPDTRRAGAVAELFASGDLLKLEDKSGRAIETLAAKRSEPVWAGRLAVLVNGATAGAGEALAVILRDSRKATVYGEPTYGLGTEPKLIDLPEGGGVLVPGYVWESTSGKRWNAEGVAPEKAIKSEGRLGDRDEDQLKRALEDFAKVALATPTPKAA